MAARICIQIHGVGALGRTQVGLLLGLRSRVAPVTGSA